WANTELGPWADLLGAGTSRALEVSLPQSSEGYETPSKVTLGGMLATSTVTVSSRLPPGRPPLIVTTPLAWGKALARPEGTSPNWKILMPRVPGTGAGRRACGCSAAGR